MRQRCYYEKHDFYHDYGGRGIEVCEEWRQSFEQFYEDMGDCPEGMSIERIDPNGNYCPSNCKWDTNSNQGFNKNIRPTNTSGRTGVCFHTTNLKWCAAITLNYEHYHLGSFDSFEEAVKAREEAELKYFGKIKHE